MFEPNQRTPRTIWWAAILFCTITFTESWFRWKTFQYQTFDLAFYVQGLWQALHGQGNVSLLDVPLMGNHAEPIVFLLLPFFWIWKHPMLLIAAQTALLATMPFTAYRIAAVMEFSASASVGLALATLLAPAAGFGALHEFHPETLAAPLILLLLEARLKRQAGLHFLWFLLAVMCKENIALMLAWMCAVHFLIERKRGREWQVTMNALPGLIALGWVLAYGLWLAPKWNGGRVDYSGLYGHLRGADGTYQIGRIFSAAWHGLTSGNLVGGLLLPFIFLPILRLRWLIIAAPLFLQHLLSERSSEWQIYWHYGVPLLALMWFAATEAAARLFWRDSVAIYILAACVIVQLWFGPIRHIGRTIADAGAAWRKSRPHAAFVAAIPAEGSVTASLGFLSHFAKREHLQSLQLVSMGVKTLGGSRYTPQPTEHVLIDFADEFTFSREAGSLHPKMQIRSSGETVPSSDELLHRFLRTDGLWPVSIRNSCAYFSRAEPVRSSAPLVAARKLDEKTRLISIIPAPLEGDDFIHWKITWELGGERSFFPWCKLWLRAANGSNHYITKGPTLLGSELGQFTESWHLTQPYIAPGTYKAVLVFHDPLESSAATGFAPVGFEVGELEIK